MEDDPSSELWFAIAEAIGGRTVAELQAVMSNAEFVAWTVYLARKGQRQELASKRAGGPA